MVRKNLVSKKADMDFASIVADEISKRNSGLRRWIWNIHNTCASYLENKVLK